MDGSYQLRCFQERSKSDKRIRPSHISLYIALLWFYDKSEFQAPFVIYRKEVMKMAAISSIATYHKVLQELVRYHYIWYQPSYDSHQGSRVAFKFDRATAPQKSK